MSFGNNCNKVVLFLPHINTLTDQNGTCLYLHGSVVIAFVSSLFFPWRSPWTLKNNFEEGSAGRRRIQAERE